MLDWFRGLFHRETKIVRDEISQQLADLLFPELEETTVNEQTFLVDYSVDSNLESVLLDLEEGNNDGANHETLRQCIKKLQEARSLLESHQKLPSKSTYLIVDNP